MSHLAQDRPSVRSPVSRLWASLVRREGLTPREQVAIFALALLAIFSRRPDAFLRPQFFAEDGWIWYQQAYNLGWLHSLTLPHLGHMQTLPRLVTGIALLLPLRWAPLLMNFGGAIVQALPNTALLSRRCAGWGSLSTRILMAVVYLAIADAAEVHVNITNAMWHLALLQGILALAHAPGSARQRLADILVFGIGGVSGPFSIFLLPIVAAFWWIRRRRWTLVILAILAVGASIQLTTILHSVRAPDVLLGDPPISFIHLIGGNVVLHGMVGTRAVARSGGLLTFAFFVGLAILLLGTRAATLPVRLFLLFAAIVTAFSLHYARWWAISQVPDVRYWFFPSLIFLWTAVCCAAAARPRPLRALGCAVLLLTTFGDLRSWRYRPWPDNHLPGYAHQLETASPGRHVVFPIYPAPGTMDLIKH